MRKIILLLLLVEVIQSFAQNIICLLPEGTELDILAKKGELIHPSSLRIGPNGQLYMIVDGLCINYYKPNSNVLAFPSGFQLNDIYWLENEDCLFSDSSSVYYRAEASDSVYRILHTDMTPLCFKPSRKGIYFYKKGGNELHFLSYSNSEAKRICNFASPITDIETLANDCYVAFGNTVGIIIDNTNYVTLFKIGTSVNSIASNIDGVLFYGTSEGLFYYDDAGRQFQICNLGVRKLLSYDNDLYVCFLDNSAACIHGLTTYSDIAKQLSKKENNLIDKILLKNNNYEESRDALKHGLIDIALVHYFTKIQKIHDERSFGAGVNGELMAEYAYTLALHHDFEAALMNIDRARMVGTKYGDFYAAQVLTLMGYTDAAQQLMKQAKVPDWIDGIYQGLNDKYKITASVNLDAPETALKRANKLAGNRQTIQAVALFEELAAIYPNTYIIYVNYSTVWESLGHYAYAAQLLQKGINLMPQEENGNKQVFQNHLTKLNQMKSNFENASWLKRLLGMNPPKMMTYVGASAAKDFYSLNGRLGVYTSNKFSASLNVGLNYASEEFSGSIGVSGSKAWGIFVGGLGITDMFGKDTNTWSLTPTVGLSFLNKDQTSSFDIMLNGYVPFSSDQKFSYSISVGKTIYFDLNGLLK